MVNTFNHVIFLLKQCRYHEKELENPARCKSGFLSDLKLTTVHRSHLLRSKVKQNDKVTFQKFSNDSDVLHLNISKISRLCLVIFIYLISV